MRYEGFLQLNKEKMLSELESVNIKNLQRLLVSLCELDDRDFSESILLKCLSHKNELVISASIIGLGHLARVHKQIDRKRVFIEFKRISKKFPELSGTIQNACEDIEIYTKR